MQPFSFDFSVPLLLLSTVSITICTFGVARGDNGEGGVAGIRSVIGVTGADFDLCAVGESAGKVLLAKEDGGLMADDRLLLDGDAALCLWEVMSPFPPFICVRIEVLSNFVPLLGGGEGGETLLLL